jgi:hypothetical protein
MCSSIELPKEIIRVTSSLVSAFVLVKDECCSVSEERIKVRNVISA